MHVLGTPPAFILSQDQTLRSNGLAAASVRLIQAEICLIRPAPASGPGPNRRGQNVRLTLFDPSRNSSTVSGSQGSAPSALVSGARRYFTRLPEVCQRLFSNFFEAGRRLARRGPPPPSPEKDSLHILLLWRESARVDIDLHNSCIRAAGDAGNALLI